jgi:spore maturation protein CgeB
MRMLVVDAMPTRMNPNPNIIASIAEAFRRVHGSEAVQFATHWEAAAVADAQRPELILAVSSRIWRGIGPQLALVGRRHNALVGWWLTDDPYEIDENLSQAKYADFVATNDRASMPLYTETPVLHLPLAADREKHFRPVRQNDKDYERDVFFCGFGFPNRRGVVLSAAPFLSKLKTLILGPAWGGCPLVASERISNTTLTDLYNSSRIVLNLPRVFNLCNKRDFPASTPAPRTFEAAAAGAFQLATADRPELHRHYDIPSELDIFCNTAELEEKIAWHLAHPEQRIEAAQKAQARTMSQDTYDHRAATVLKYAASLLESRAWRERRLAA